MGGDYGLSGPHSNNMSLWDLLQQAKPDHPQDLYLHPQPHMTCDKTTQSLNIYNISHDLMDSRSRKPWLLHHLKWLQREIRKTRDIRETQPRGSNAVATCV